jgi:hypothetical protein
MYTSNKSSFFPPDFKMLLIKQLADLIQQIHLSKYLKAYYVPDTVFLVELVLTE